MQLANKLIISPVEDSVPSRWLAPSQVMQDWLGIVVTGLVGIALLALMIQYNLKHVPSSEVDRIYKNAGSAVKRSFQLK